LEKKKWNQICKQGSGKKGGTKRERGTEDTGGKKKANGPLVVALLAPQAASTSNNRGKERSLLCSTGGFGSWALEII